MRWHLIAIAISILAADDSVTGWARESYPRVEVAVTVVGRSFADIPSPQLTDLKHDIAKSFSGVATRSFPCMEWMPIRSESLAAPARTVLFVNLVEQPYGNSSQVFLSLSGTIEGGATDPERLRGLADWLVLSPLEEYAGNVAMLRQKLIAAIEKKLSTDEFALAFNKAFISQVTIARHIEIDAADRWVMIPVDAARLRLEDDAPLIVALEAPFCRTLPVRCTLELASRGPAAGGGFTNFLRAELIKGPQCCSKDGWTAQLPEQIAKARPGSIQVFLGATHRHCPFGLRLCPKRNGLYGDPGVK
jgi:hypothetical protein